MSDENIVNAFLDEKEIPEEVDPRDELLQEIEDYQKEVDDVESDIEKLKTSGNPITNVNIFTEMSDLNARAVSVLDAVKSDIESSSLLDAELISSYASLIKSTREITSDYIDIYRDHQNHMNRIEFEGVKQENRKELLQFKNNLDNIQDTSYTNKIPFIQEVVVDLLNQQKKAEEAEEEAE